MQYWDEFIVSLLSHSPSPPTEDQMCDASISQDCEDYLELEDDFIQELGNRNTFLVFIERD